MIPYGRQDISEEDIAEVDQVLRSDFLTQGPTVPRFERAVADFVGAKNGIASTSATAALHLACLALEVGPGDWLWTSANTFVASANCGLYCGAQVDFIDIDPRTYNMCVKSLAEKLETAEKTGQLPKVVIPVHFAGQPCDMVTIHALSERYGFKIIEDASHAIGASLGQEKIGACTYSDLTVFSFHPVKIITSGEGGMVLTNDDELTNKIRIFRTHGITNDVLDFDPRLPDEIWNYQQQVLGFNYRMTDIQAALGISQLGRVDEFVVKRHGLAERYDDALSALPLSIPWQAPDTHSAYHLYPIVLQKGCSQKSQRELYDFMRARHILVNLHYIPVYRHPYFERIGFEKNYCPNAEAYFKSALSIPMFASLKREQQDRVISVLKEALANTQ
jgi:UDP-4-amino-4,6-dideoxy-N-acetyl-beta-L-altrosamine transaminase